MDCVCIDREEIVERYLAGRLDEGDREAFERHFSSCAGCFEKLRAAALIQEILWEGNEIIDFRTAPKRSASRRRLWSLIAAAAGVLLAVGGAAWWWTSSGRPPSLTALSRFDPPLYLAPLTRSPADAAGEMFRSGMDRYQEGKFAEAIPALRRASQMNLGGAGIRFFLGICLLMTEDVDQGIAELEECARLGDEAYLIEARYYSAKGFLRKGDMIRARRELEIVVESGGKLREEASELLGRLK